MCGMERYDTDYGGTSTDVADAIGQTLTMSVPGYEVVPDGTYIGEETYTNESPYRGSLLRLKSDSIAGVTVNLTSGTVDGNGNMCVSVTVDEERRLRFLFYDYDRKCWYLSCGGERSCWWCQDDDAFDTEVTSGWDWSGLPTLEELDDYGWW